MMMMMMMMMMVMVMMKIKIIYIYIHVMYVKVLLEEFFYHEFSSTELKIKTTYQGSITASGTERFKPCKTLWI